MIVGCTGIDSLGGPQKVIRGMQMSENEILVALARLRNVGESERETVKTRSLNIRRGFDVDRKKKSRDLVDCRSGISGQFPHPPGRRGL